MCWCINVFCVCDGDGKMTYIIAEAGINHNGKLKLAKQLVDVSKDAGADAVKFQTFTNIHRLKKYELSYGEFRELKIYCDKKNIIFLSTPHTFDAIHFLDDLVPMYKIASTYLTNANFLTEVADKKKPILLSTGNIMSDSGIASIDVIRRALKTISNSDVTLLHCVSKYPCYNPRYDLIDRLSMFNKIVGISDHSTTIDVPKVAVIEKHIKLCNIVCIDDQVSLYPEEFSLMVNRIRGENNDKTNIFGQLQ